MFIFKKYILFFLILIFNFNVVNATPLVNKDWLKHTMVKINKDGKDTFDYKPVKLDTLTDEVETVKLKARTY